MELDHLRAACDLMRRHDGREPEQVLPPALPEPVTFEPNREYIRHLLATQIDLTTLGAGYVRDAHERFQQVQQQINGGEKAPSERVIDMHREEFGHEYRIQVEGPHPVRSLREKEVTRG